jgi:CDK-activating kinase assembly factor MAT1
LEKVVREIRERRKREKEEMEKKAEIQVQIVRKRRMPARKGGLDEEQVMEYTAHVPTSPSYEGPYVPLPYSQPKGVLGDVTGSIITTTNGYVDVDPMAKSIKADGEGKYRAGGFFLEDVWKREIGLALDSLCIDAPS